MDIYLATTGTYNTGQLVHLAEKYAEPYIDKPHGTPSKLLVLESFYYLNDWMLPYILNQWDFLLDSGAFSFFGKQKDLLNWDTYLEKYANFINQCNVQRFFELDIDVVVGLDKVEQLRERLISLTGKLPIVVWRPLRGIKYWQHMIETYPYIAISASGMYDSAWTRKNGSEHVLRQMVKQAQAKNVKVHGLGYTSLKHLSYIGWNSVDSTAWIYGNMSSKIYQFNGTTIKTIPAPPNTRMKSKVVAVHNFTEWVKFQQYAKYNL